MALSDEEILKELDSWEGFIGALPEKDGALAAEALELGRGYSSAVLARGSPFTTEPLLMSLLLAQHKEIARLTAELERLKETKGARADP